MLWISLYFIQQHHQLEALNIFIFRGISQQIACMITVQEYDFWKWATHERLKSQVLPHSLPFLYLCDVQIDVRPLRVHTLTSKSFNMQGFQCAVFNLYVDDASMSEKAVNLCPTKDNSIPWAQIPEWSALLLTSLSTSLSLSSWKVSVVHRVSAYCGWIDPKASQESQTWLNERKIVISWRKYYL